MPPFVFGVSCEPLGPVRADVGGSRMAGMDQMRLRWPDQIAGRHSHRATAEDERCERDQLRARWPHEGCFAVDVASDNRIRGLTRRASGRWQAGCRSTACGTRPGLAPGQASTGCVAYSSEPRTGAPGGAQRDCRNQPDLGGILP